MTEAAHREYFSHFTAHSAAGVLETSTLTFCETLNTCSVVSLQAKCWTAPFKPTFSPTCSNTNNHLHYYEDTFSLPLLYTTFMIIWSKIELNFCLLQLSPRSPSHHRPASVSTVTGRAPPCPTTTPMTQRPLTWLPLPSSTCPRAAGRSLRTSAPNPRTRQTHRFCSYVLYSWL